MQKRKETPDILSNLMSKESDGDSKPAKQQNSTPVNIDKTKATFYLSQPTIDALEDAWFQLRKKATAKGDVSKSLIVETALKLAIEDLNEHGTSSQLAGILL